MDNRIGQQRETLAKKQKMIIVGVTFKSKVNEGREEISWPWDDTVAIQL